ncbi:MAG: hypothetical protein ACRDPA_11720, partial [Solirubrobacteraceae bacterium]
ATLDHYLELLARKPGALARSLPLAQDRDRGNWPQTVMSYGQRSALGGVSRMPTWTNKQMVDMLMLCREHGPATVELAARGALAAGAMDGPAVAVLARRNERRWRGRRRSSLLPTPWLHQTTIKARRSRSSTTTAISFHRASRLPETATVRLGHGAAPLLARGCDDV